MCCVEFLVKYILFFANLVFSLAGLALVVVGSIVLVQLEDLFDVIPLDGLGIAIIVVGSIIFLVSFFGCCGAIKQNPCMLVTYVVLMAILAGLKIWLSTVIFSNLSSLDTLVSGWLNSAFTATNTAPFHVLEYTFTCCGTVGPESYTTPILPPSCCGITDSDLVATCTSQAAYSQGCVSRMSDYLDSFGSAIGGVLVVVVAVELVAVLFGLFMACTSCNKRKANHRA